MDNFEYLNQISQSVRPTKPSRNNSFIKIIAIALVGIVLFFVLMIVGMVLNNAGGESTGELTSQLSYRISNLNTTISSYSPAVKSSRLRSISASLSATLISTQAQLVNFNRQISGGETEGIAMPTGDLLEAENKNNSNLNTSLKNARLNGILDRVYLNQITLQVSLLCSLETQLAGTTQNPDLINILQQSLTSLTVIQNDLNSFSDLSS